MSAPSPSSARASRDDSACSEPTGFSREAWPDYRAHQRRRSHDDAHAEAVGDRPAFPDHPLIPANREAIVTDEAALVELIEQVREAGVMAYDTEFIGEQTFYPRFCLIQIATPGRVTLVDALCELNLDPLWSLLADQNVATIVHAGRQDLEPAVRIVGDRPRSVFDTQVAAGFCGLSYPMSLSNLVSEVLGADTGQGLKFSQWDRRPLTDRQRYYASNDVRFLLALREALEARLIEARERSGRCNDRWCRMALEELCRPDQYEPDPLEQKVKAQGLHTLSRPKRAVLERLQAWRWDEGRRRDMPPRLLLPDLALGELAHRPVHSHHDLRQIKGMPRPTREAYADTIIQQTREALDGPLPPPPPKVRKLSDRDQQRLEEAWSRFLTICNAAEIAPALVGNRKEITQLLREHFTGRTLPADHRLLVGWRAELLEDLWREMEIPAVGS